MNVTKSTLNSSSQDRSVQRKAVIGGGIITPPSVSAHVRRTMMDSIPPNPHGQALQRKAIVGGGIVTPPSVAAHLRKTIAEAGTRPIDQLP